MTNLLYRISLNVFYRIRTIILVCANIAVGLSYFYAGVLLFTAIVAQRMPDWHTFTPIVVIYVTRAALNALFNRLSTVIS